jgi:hypothetical protein
MKASVVVDEAGCLVLPKQIREAIGVFGRTSVQIEVVDKFARISALEESSSIGNRKRTRTVYTGPLPEGWDSGEAVLKSRERKMWR